MRGTTGRARRLRRAHARSSRRPPRAPQACRRPPATLRSPSPGRRLPPTAARRSRATRCTAARARAARIFANAIGTPSARRFTDTTRRERHDLLLQGDGRERDRREPALERGLRDPGGARAACRAAARPSTTSTAEREPALGRGALDERRQRLGSRPACTSLEHARLLEVDDVHGLAQRRPVRPRHRGRGPALDPARRRTTSCACTRACSSRARTAYDGYMLRTNQLAGTDQVLLERVDNGTSSHALTINQELAAGDVLLLRVKGPTLEAWRNDGSALVAARLRHRLDLRRRRLRRRRHARHDRPRRRLRRAHARSSRRDAALRPPEPAGDPR